MLTTLTRPKLCTHTQSILSFILLLYCSWGKQCSEASNGSINLQKIIMNGTCFFLNFDNEVCAWNNISCACSFHFSRSAQGIWNRQQKPCKSTLTRLRSHQKTKWPFSLHTEIETFHNQVSEMITLLFNMALFKHRSLLITRFLYRGHKHAPHTLYCTCSNHGMKKINNTMLYN